MDPITNEEDVKYHLGKFYFQKNNYKKAITAYKKGLVINSQSTILLYEIGLVYSELESYKTALKYWKKLLKITTQHNMLAVEAKRRIANQICKGAMKQPQIKWYLKPVSIIIAILCIGPFALPLVWLSPAFKKSHKIIITILVIILFIWLVKASIGLYDIFLKELQTLQDLLKP